MGRHGRGRCGPGGRGGVAQSTRSHRLQFRPRLLEPNQLCAAGQATEASDPAGQGRRHDGLPGAGAEPRFRAQCRWHSGIESTIHQLQSHGLGRVRHRCRQGFANTVALAVIAVNLQRVGELARKHSAQYASRRHRPVWFMPDWVTATLT